MAQTVGATWNFGKKQIANSVRLSFFGLKHSTANKLLISILDDRPLK